MKTSYSLLRLAAINSVDLTEFNDVENVAAALRRIKDTESQLAIHEAMHKRVRKRLQAQITEARREYDALLERYRPGKPT